MHKLISLSIATLMFVFSAAVSAGATKWVDFDLSTGHVRIPVKVGGVETFAILDSGAGVHGVSQAFLDTHGIEARTVTSVMVQGLFGEAEKRRVYRDLPLELFESDHQMEVVSLELDPNFGALIIGEPLFQEYIVQIDYPNRKLRMLTRDAVDLRSIKNLDLRVQKGTGNPLVNITLNQNESRWFLLDTGSSLGVFMRRPLAEQLGWLEAYPTFESKVQGATGGRDVDSFLLPSVKIGPYELADVRVTVPGAGSNLNIESEFQDSFSRIKDVKVEGYVGFDLLQHFVLTLDYKNGYGHIWAP